MVAARPRPPVPDAVRPRPVRLSAGLLALVLAAALSGCSLFGEGPDKALQAFLTGWQSGKLGGLDLLDPDGRPLAGDAAQTQLTQYEGDLAVARPKLAVQGKPKTEDDNASATVAVAWPIVEGVTWEYTTTVRLRKGEQWRAFFGPATVHPDLRSTDKFAVKRTAAERGAVLDGAGQPLVTKRPVVVVGLEPRRVKNIEAEIKQFGDAIKAAGVDVTKELTELPAQVGKAKPDAFVTIVTLRQEAYTPIAARIKAIPSNATRTESQALAPSRVFARALLGHSGEVTKEIMDKNPGKYRVGDVVGLSGLQQQYDTGLRGKGGISVVIPAAQGASPKTLFSTDPVAGTPIRTTLDVATQNAADEVLATETRRSAIVAVRVSDGAVLAVANGPGPAAVNLALTGQVPPGSTFKAVTALALLDNGSVTPSTPVDCPKTLTIEGQPFKNAEDMVLNTVPFEVNFAKSCNTAFVSLAPKLGSDGLAKTAQTLGVGVPWDLGTDVNTGSVATGGSAADQAAAAFGQGKTTVSPIVLAAASAAIARGQWKQPRLVTEPAPAKVAPDGPALKQTSLDALRPMMRKVVTEGTASPLKAVAGLHGKTGTAEYDNDVTHTHSWFMGYRNDIAFAVFVENGGLSTETAVPLAGRFFAKLG
ncbi:MAG TPA: penicillin-binding transpeptidase domain-containing protein [Micromonosporaceae bacterium]|nr:penicillin-binding transpeptidase domain-containing protein [Micromonosporaceae bacterium]